MVFRSRLSEIIIACWKVSRESCAELNSVLGDVKSPLPPPLYTTQLRRSHILRAKVTAPFPDRPHPINLSVSLSAPRRHSQRGPESF